MIFCALRRAFLVFLLLTTIAFTASADPRLSPEFLETEDSLTFELEGLDPNQEYWVILYDPKSQLGRNGDYYAYETVPRDRTTSSATTSGSVTFQNVEVETLAVFIVKAIRGSVPLDQIQVRGTAPETTAIDPRIDPEIVESRQTLTVGLRGLDPAQDYWVVLFDPETQVGRNGDYFAFETVRRSGLSASGAVNSAVSFRNVASDSLAVLLLPAVRGSAPFDQLLLRSASESVSSVDSGGGNPNGPRATAALGGVFTPEQQVSVNYENLDSNETYVVVLFDPNTQTGQGSDFIQSRQMRFAHFGVAVFHNILVGEYIVRLHRTDTSTPPLTETRVLVRGQREGSGPLEAIGSLLDLTTDAFRLGGIDEDALLDRYESQFTCERMEAHRLVVDLLEAGEKFNGYARISGRFTILNANDGVVAEGPVWGRSASYSRRSIVLRLDYDTLRQLDLLDVWPSDAQFTISPDLRVMSRESVDCRNLTLTAIVDSRAPRNLAPEGSQLASIMTQVRYLSEASVRSVCSSATTASEVQDCLLTSLQFDAGPGTLRNYNGSTLSIVLPGSPLVPDSSECRFFQNEARRDLDAMATDYFVYASDRRPFEAAVQTRFGRDARSCSAFYSIREEIIGDTLELRRCRSTIRTVSAFQSCLEDFMDTYAPDRLAEMKAHAAAVFQEALGEVPAIVNSRFSGNAREEVLNALNEDAAWCRRGAENPELLNIGNDPFGSATGRIIVGAVFSGLTQKGVETLDGSKVRRRVSCEDVMLLLGRFTDRGDTLLEEYQDLTTGAQEQLCENGNRENGPDARLLASALNRYLTSNCSSDGFLSFWLEDVTEGEGSDTTPLALGLMEFDGRNNRCKMTSTLTTQFTEPEVSFWVANANIREQTFLDPNQVSIDAAASLSCTSPEMDPLVREYMCSMFKAGPAHFSAIANWSDQSCDWTVTSVERARQ